MPNKYYDAISHIKMDENKKQELAKFLKEKNEPNKGVIFMTKVRKVLTSIAAVAGIAICGGAVYAGITGKIKLFNNKVDTEYENYAQVVEAKSVENEYSKITLESVACDDAYLILNYTVDVKESAKEVFSKIKLDSRTGFEMNFDNNTKINDVTIENYGNFSQKVINKVTDSQAKVYEVIDLTGKDIPTEFNLEISDFMWYAKDISEGINVNDKISIKV